LVVAYVAAVLAIFLIIPASAEPIEDAAAYDKGDERTAIAIYSSRATADTCSPQDCDGSPRVRMRVKMICS
jgi:hypothetical protein